ncbi:hypothetical protein DBR28_00180 [Chryseobacterium sp. HMWF028]|jgi:hypothetical protein|nr:hypothetical protein DBR28_00180 [Chryseobacterium sp. HMWF028]
MNLMDLIKNLNETDDDLIIFIENINNFTSDIMLSYAEEGDNGVKEENNKKYHYLLEIFLAKEFVSDWIASLDYSPSNEAIARRLYEYGINDA